MRFSIMVTAVVKPAHRHSYSGNNAAGHFSRQTEEIAKDISSLAQNAAAIDESFEFVLRRMEKCKTQHPGMTKKLREDLDLLVDEWKKNHSMYREQLWKSYDLACKASVAAEDFADVLLQGVLLNSDITLQEKQDAVADYCKKVDSDILGAAELVDGFKQLLYQVESFKEQWKDVVRQNDISLSTGQIKAIDKEIVTLRNKIERYQNELTSNSNPESLSLASHAVRLICKICPGWSQSNASKLEMLSELRSAQSDNIPAFQQQLQTLMEKRKKKQAKLAAWHALDVCFDESQYDIDNVKGRLCQFSKVWVAIRGDLYCVQNFLQEAANNHGKLSIMFQQRIQKACNIYKLLADIFRAYERAIDVPTRLERRD